MKYILLSVVALGISAAGFNLHAEWAVFLKNYDCLEVQRFSVDRENYSSQKLERAATIPDEILGELQHKIVGQSVREKLVGKVVKAEEQECQGRALIYGGKVTEYKRGSRVARIMIGLGAGKQKFEVESFLRDKSSGETLATKTVVDRKVGGLAGGDEEKGQRDFAEKAVHFIRDGI